MPLTTAIVVPQRGKQHLTHDLVADLDRHEPRVPLFVVDDGHGSEFAAVGPIGHAAVVPNTTGRTGWVRAANVGVKACNADFVVLLNNDVRVDGPFVSRLVEAAQQNAIAGAAMRADPDLHTLVLEGWCLAFDRLLYNLVGGFDERFSLYFADTDFQRVARRDHCTALTVVNGLPLRHLGHRTAHDKRIVPRQRAVWATDREAFRAKRRAEAKAIQRS